MPPLIYTASDDESLSIALRRALGDDLYADILDGRESPERLSVVRRLVESLPPGTDLPAWFSSTDAFTYFSPREVMQGEWDPADWIQRLRAETAQD